MKVALISDFLYDEIPGGAESNDIILKGLLEERNIEVDYVKTENFNKSLSSYTNIDSFIVSNFYFISDEAKDFLMDKKYIIIEHDYKFLKTRNPSEYDNCIVPTDKIVHKSFYKYARKILTQSRLQRDIFVKNLNLRHIESFGGNLWRSADLEYIESLSEKPKNGKAAILDEGFWIKNKQGAIDFCKRNQITYDLIPKQEYYSFLDSLSNYSLYLFFPLIPETLSRVTLEAKMMNLAVITNEYTGAYFEDYYPKSGRELIKEIWNKRDEIVEIIEDLLHEG